MTRPSAVLGLCAFTHDSAAALFVDGRLVGMVEEERLSGVKHTKDYPGNAVAWLLGEAGLRASDLEVVAYNFDGVRHLGVVPGSAALLLDRSARGAVVPRIRGFTTVYGNYRRRMRSLRERFPKASVLPVQHHRAHGLYAFAASGVDDAAVLVIDSLGEYQTTTIAGASRVGSDVLYRTVQSIRDPASLGYAYGAVTQHLGWRRGDEEGTVMALAALGDPTRFRSLMRAAIRITPTGFTLDARHFPVRTLLPGSPRVTYSFIDQTCPPRASDEEVGQVHADLAAALQERTEEVVVHLARRAATLTGSRHLCVGGGVAMNCLSVGKVLASGVFDRVTVPPAPGDSGTSIGAALEGHITATGKLPTGVDGTCYIGPVPGSAPPDAQPGPWTGLSRMVVSHPADFLAAKLVGGLIVGVARGRAEVGPRALGNRSILASPLMPGVVDRLNRAVKFREPFRPFAPVVLAEKARDFFVLDQPSPYMSIAVPVTARTRQQIPAIVHANGTARVQTVTAAQHPFLVDVLQAVGKLTGVPMLINTSLNVKGKPMCGTVEAALDCLHESGLDALMLDDGVWVTKDREG